MKPDEIFSYLKKSQTGLGDLFFCNKISHRINSRNLRDGRQTALEAAN